MTVAVPAGATLGQSGTINLTFSGLTARTKYLGSVAYSGATGMPSRRARSAFDFPIIFCSLGSSTGGDGVGAIFIPPWVAVKGIGLAVIVKGMSLPAEVAWHLPVNMNTHNARL